MIIKDGNYITILAPMITKLGLKGNELLVFALVHGFSQDGESTFKGSLKYLCDWTGLDRSTVIRLLKLLTEKKYINKEKFDLSNLPREYKSNYFEVLEGWQNATPPVAKCDPPGGKMQRGGVAKCDPILIDNITNDINNIAASKKIAVGLFPENDEKIIDKKKTSIFRNSEVFLLRREIVNENSEKYFDYSDFEKLFSGKEFAQIDLVYYFNSVLDWSETKIGIKRNFNGWIATVRNFIRGDLSKGKMKLKPEYQPEQQRMNINAAKEYLNNDY